MAMLKRLHLSWVSTRFISPILLAGVILSSAGGATHQMYRPDLTPGAPGSRSAVWNDKDGKPYFGIVEFDDQGERWDSSVKTSDSGSPKTQLQAVTQAIRRAGGHGDKPFYLVVFAHGWNNNASQDNYDRGNLNDFHARIQELRGFHKKDGVEVFGVYVAWRGKTPYFPFNFYDRNEGGHRVGERATGTIFELVVAGRQASQHSKIALIGHSFGCHIIESAITPALQADIARAPLHGNSIDLAADLVLLINPARSSLYTKPLVDQLRDTPVRVVDPDGQKHKLPLIVTVTSEGDTATGTWFPFGYQVGRRISVFNTSVSGQYRKNPPRPGMTPDPVDQSFSHQHTAGWNPALYSHFVCKEPIKAGQRPPSGPEEMLRANYRPWTNEGDILIHGTKQNYRILPLVNPYNDTAYWIMQVPTDIIGDHTDIWRPECVCLVTALLYLPNHDEQKTDPVKKLPPLETAPNLFSKRLSAQRLK